MDAQELKWARETFRTGHFWNPRYPDLWNVTWDDVPKLNFDSPEMQRALRSRSWFEVYPYAKICLDCHGRRPIFDGLRGPALERLLDTDRCGFPDYDPPAGVEPPCFMKELWNVGKAVGRGNWKRCHDVGNFHSAIVEVNRNGIGAHLEPVFLEVLRHVQAAYAEVGLLFIFVENGWDMLTGEVVNAPANIQFSFVQRSDGWIGLAVIGQNQTCESVIWCRYLAGYRGGEVIVEWVTLIKHELGHNCGRGHTRGGVMNPSIIRGLPFMWPVSDPTYDWLNDEFGGIRVPIGPAPPGPGPDPPTDLETRIATLEEQVETLQVQNIVQDEFLLYLANRLGEE